VERELQVRQELQGLQVQQIEETVEVVHEVEVEDLMVTMRVEMVVKVLL
jgi:hypothetical protein